VLIPEAEKYGSPEGRPKKLGGPPSFSWFMVHEETGRGGDRPSKNDSNFDSKLLRIEKHSKLLRMLVHFPGSWQLMQ